MYFPQPVSARVIINEVHPAPSTGPEWVELFSTETEPTTLSGWYLEDHLASPSVIHTFDNITIDPGAFLLVELASAKLNNTADGVTLKNAAGTVVDMMEYPSTQPGKSWARQPNGSDSFHLADPTPNTTNGQLPQPSPSPKPSMSPSPTPSPSNQPSPSPTSDPHATSIQLSEIMSCPASGDTEWLEVYNPTEQTITISNWLIRDASNTSRTVSTTIPAQSFGILSWSGSLLNNTGDTLTLFTNTGQEIAQAAISSCQAGQSYIWHSSTWQLTHAPTKGSANIPDEPAAEELTETNDLPTTATSDTLAPTPPAVSSDLKVMTDTSMTPTLPTTYSAQLHLDSPLVPPPPAIINLAQPETSKWGVINVILGGVFLLGAAGQLLHEHHDALS